MLFRKPLLYPSELRGHERGTIACRFNLRKAPLALSKVRMRALATVLATVWHLFSPRETRLRPKPQRIRQADDDLLLLPDLSRRVGWLGRISLG